MREGFRMKLLFLVLNDPDILDRVLEKLERHGVRGATILHSRGMAMELENYMGGSFLGTLRAAMEPDREENYTVFMVLSDEKVKLALSLIDEVVDLDEPGKGVAFTVPVDFTKGIGEC